MKKNYTLNDRIKENNKEILKSAFLTTVSTVALGVGVYGTIHISKELIDTYMQGNSFNLATKDNELYGVIYSALLFYGFVGTFSKGNELKKNLQYRKKLTMKQDNDQYSEDEHD